jgi:hypothetical protein
MRGGMFGSFDQQEIGAERLGDAFTEVDERLIGRPGLQLPPPG